MKAWEVTKPGSLEGSPVRFANREPPVPGPRDVLVQVKTCGVCRTDLHIVTGDLPAHRDNVVPGHEIVGTVVARGGASSRFDIGTRIGIAWLRACGCRKLELACDHANDRQVFRIEPWAWGLGGMWRSLRRL